MSEVPFGLRMDSIKGIIKLYQNYKQKENRRIHKALYQSKFRYCRVYAPPAFPIRI